MLEDSFEIYYYEDFPASGVAPHSHSFYEFYFLLEGQVLMTIQDRPYTVTPGNIIMIPARSRSFSCSEGARFALPALCTVDS